MKLFGTDGVRGQAGSFLTASLAMRLAQAAGVYFKKYAKTIDSSGKNGFDRQTRCRSGS